MESDLALVITVISEFQKGHLTIRESAKLLDLTYEGFIELLGERNLSFINTSQDELAQSYVHFEIQLMAMANDLQIQKELQIIEEESAIAISR